MRRWFGPDADPEDPELQAGAITLDKRETERVRIAVHNGITGAIRFK